MKKLTVAVLTALIILIGCGSDEGKAKVPFAYSDRIGANYKETISELEEAGFENITTESISTTREDKDGQISSIRIDGSNTFIKLMAYKTDVPVIIKYYAAQDEEESQEEKDEEPETVTEFEPTMDISIGGEEGFPEITVKTNFPDGTVLDFEMTTDDDFDFLNQQSATVEDGMVTFDAVSNNGKPLEENYNYSFGIAMLLYGQPESVKEVFGENGKNLTGDLVVGTEEKRWVQANYEYPLSFKSAGEEEEKKMSFEEVVQLVRLAMAESFSNGQGSYEVTQEENGITISLRQDGIAMVALLASQGDEENLNRWNDLVEVVRMVSENMQTNYLTANGYEDKAVLVNMVNDMDEDTVLLQTLSGMVIYDGVNDVGRIDSE